MKTILAHTDATALNMTVTKEDELTQAASGAYYMRTNFYLEDPKAKTVVKFRDLKSINAYLAMVRADKKTK